MKTKVLHGLAGEWLKELPAKVGKPQVIFMEMPTILERYAPPEHAVRAIEEWMDEAFQVLASSGVVVCHCPTPDITVDVLETAASWGWYRATWLTIAYPAGGGTTLRQWGMTHSSVLVFTQDGGYTWNPEDVDTSLGSVWQPDTEWPQLPMGYYQRLLAAFSDFGDVVVSIHDKGMAVAAAKAKRDVIVIEESRTTADQIKAALANT